MATVTEMLQAQKAIHKALVVDHGALSAASEKLRQSDGEKESALKHKDAQISLLRNEIEELKQSEADRAKEARADDAAWRQVSVSMSLTSIVHSHVST